MYERVTNYLGWTLVIPALAALLASVLRADAMRRAIGGVPWLDWQTYANAMERLLGGGNLYDGSQLAGPYLLPKVVEVGYAYPPPSIFLFAPFSGGTVGLIAWLFLNACLLVSGVAAIFWLSMRLAIPWALSLAAMSLALFPPFSDGMAVGNVNVGLAGILAWSWVLNGRGRWLGSVAGFVALLKVFPGSLVAWSWRSHGWSQFRDAALIFAGVSLITLPVVGIDSWTDFVRAMANAQPACIPHRISVACAMGPLIGMGSAKVAGIAIGLVAFGGAMVVRSRFAAFALIALAILAPVTDIWLHYWLFPYVVAVAGLANVIGPHFGRSAAAMPDVALTPTG